MAAILGDAKGNTFIAVVLGARDAAARVTEMQKLVDFFVKGDEQTLPNDSGLTGGAGGQSMTLATFSIIRMLVATAFAAVIAFLLSPRLIAILNDKKFWKKEARMKRYDGKDAVVFNRLHRDRETKVPRGGGIVIWMSVSLVILIFWLIAFLPDPWWARLFNFLTRRETWLPLFTLVVASLVGLFDDVLTVYAKGKYIWRWNEFLATAGYRQPHRSGGRYGGFIINLGYTTLQYSASFNSRGD